MAKDDGWRRPALGSRRVLESQLPSEQVARTMVKAYPPVVLDALVEGLACAYWYKKDLRSFLLRAGVPKARVTAFDWDAGGPYKRMIIRDLVDALATNPGEGTKIIGGLIDSVVEIDGFRHLERLDDGPRRAGQAEVAQTRLKELLGKSSLVERADRARRERRTESARAAEEQAAREKLIQTLANRFQGLSKMRDQQARGLAFEPFLRELFTLFDLDPRGSFTAPGEQTDGSIRLDGVLYLVEARWRAEPADPADLRSFRGKVQDKLDNTLGFFISMAGFSNQAILKASEGRRMMVLMDGIDLARVLQGLVDLVEMLRRKVRHAAETGEILFRV